MIVMGRLVEKLKPEKYDVMQRHTQAGNITTNIKVILDCSLPSLSAANDMTWKCHVTDFAKGKYIMI